MRTVVLWAVILAATGCGGSDAGRDLAGPADLVWRDPDTLAHAVAFRGSCAWGRPPGQVSDYGAAVRLVRRADVRATGAFWAEDRSNVMGWLPAGAVVRAQGPVAHPKWDFEPAYAVLIRDAEDRACRGYLPVSAASPVR